MPTTEIINALPHIDAPAEPAQYAAPKPRIGFVSLGCPKNLVDSEVMMGLLHHSGAELTPDATTADIIVVNTCSFIDSAKQESVNTILEMANHKISNGGRAQKLIVAGCLVERYRDEIRKNIPDVDAVLGTGELDSILAAAGLQPRSRTQPLPNTSPFTILTGNEAANHPSPEADSRVPHLHNSATVVKVGEAAQNPTDILQTHVPHVPTLGHGIEAATKSAADAPNNTEHTLIDRASSAVRKHSQFEVEKQTSRPEGDLREQISRRQTSRAERDARERISRQQTSRAEGDAREQQGRFSREAWDGATAALPSYLYSDETPRILTTPRASAYIKIAEGCDHPCGFCIIPQLRGKFRSRRISSILNEAENLLRQGVREITLVGQDTTCYGEDLGLQDGLATLLEALATLHVEGIGRIHWLRFLYAYPNKVTTRLLETIAAHDNIAKYLDVPLQHASPTVLKRMKRGGSGTIFLRMLQKARGIVPGIAIRTAFIVGFPGETAEEFAELEAFIQAANIDWLGVFSYSDEEGAAAYDLGAKVPKRTIEARRRRLMRTQLKISAAARAAQVGRTVEVLVEGPSEETDLLWKARTLHQAPEIDGHVLLNDFGPHETLVPGTFYQAQITEAHDYDIVARILE